MGLLVAGLYFLFSHPSFFIHKQVNSYCLDYNSNSNVKYRLAGRPSAHEHGCGSSGSTEHSFFNGKTWTTILNGGSTDIILKFDKKKSEFRFGTQLKWTPWLPTTAVVLVGWVASWQIKQVVCILYCWLMYLYLYLMIGLVAAKQLYSLLVCSWLEPARLGLRSPFVHRIQ